MDVWMHPCRLGCFWWGAGWAVRASLRRSAAILVVYGRRRSRSDVEILPLLAFCENGFFAQLEL
jgi:hypothetical protein